MEGGLPERTGTVLPEAASTPGPSSLLGAVIARELYEWRWLLVVAPILGLLARFAPMLPGLEHHGNEEIREAALVLLVLLLGIGSLLAVGGALATRDLAEGRHAFYLSRPIPTSLLWLGKLTAGLGVVVLLLFGLFSPFLVLDGPESLFAEDSRRGFGQAPLSAFAETSALQYAYSLPPESLVWLSIAQLLALVLFALLLVHAVGTILKGRGPWLGLDFVGLILIGALLWTSHAQLLGHQAYAALVVAERILLFGGAASLALAGLIQLEKGRAELGLGRRWLSKVGWAGLLTSALVIRIYAHWVCHPEVDDLKHIDVGLLSADGRYLVATGPMQGRAGTPGSFLIDLHGLPDDSGFPPGHYLGGLAPARVAANFSPRGDQLIWSQCRTLVPTDCELRITRLDTRENGAEPIADAPAEPIPVEYFYTRLALSPDGSLLALAKPRRLDIHQIDSGRLLTSVSGKGIEAVRFLDRDTVRFYHDWDEQRDPPTDISFAVADLHIPSRRVEKAGFLPVSHVPLLRNISPDGQRMLAFSLTPRRFLLLDADTGELVADLMKHLGSEDGSRFFDGRFLADGRLVVTASSKALPDGVAPDEGGTPEKGATETSAEGTYYDLRISTDVWILNGDDAEVLGHLSLDGSLGHLIAHGEIEPGRLLFSTQRALPTAPYTPTIVEPLEQRGTVWLDADEVRLHHLANGITPLALLRASPAPGSAPTHLFRGTGRSILRWHPNLADPTASLPAEIVVAPQALPPGSSNLIRPF